MAEDQEREGTLAGLWLKSAPKRKARAAPEAAATRRDAESQMGLLFQQEKAQPERAAEAAPVAGAGVAAAGEAAAVRKRRAAISAPVERRVWSVRELVTGIRLHVEQEYQDLWVEGEISNFRPAPSGHVYFTLKDGEAQLPVVLFRREAQLLRFRPQDGLAVLVRGRISIYESRGQLQLVAEVVEPRGAGALQLAFEQLKARLLAEGLFDAGRKRPLPAFPRCIGVVTSMGGAVLHDIIQVIRRRHARLNLLVYPAVVQGAGCAESVAAGIRWFNRRPAKRSGSARVPTVDLILIARGGGSIEDLAGFNDEGLARAIAGSALPVVSAVGHETDFTIADFVADLRAPTPSAAAELITTAQHRIEERVEALEFRVRRAVRYQMMLARQRFTALSFAQIQGRLHALIGRRGQRLDDLSRRLELAGRRCVQERVGRMMLLDARLARQSPAAGLGAFRRRLEAAQHSLGRLAAALTAAQRARLSHASARLHALSPVAVLSRGYALVYAADGSLLRSAEGVLPGETVRARLGRGSITATVETVDAE